MLPWAFYFDFSETERILLIGTVFLVLMIELINSGIEAAIDRISFEAHSLSKRAKDYGSAAVFLALLLCGYTWVALFLPLIHY
jgi:diacylglycerol kinase (ATP)